MSSIKSLANQTAIYGVSSIIGRFLNFLLVPLYSRVFLPDEAAVYVEMYAYVAFFIVILTYGMETSFFRYRELQENKDLVYSTVLYSILTTSFLFAFSFIIFSSNIASAIGYPGKPEYVIYFALILSLDAIASIPFAKLRAENKAWRFATIKMINISTNIIFNLLFLLVIPYLFKNYGDSHLIKFLGQYIDGKPLVEHIFLANLIASAVTVMLLLPQMNLRGGFDKKLLHQMLSYGFPLLIFGLAGIVNETLDRILLKYLLPPDVALYQLGLYGICYKISIFITIFIQAFRYAAEPFFFAQYKTQNAKQTYSIVMNFFIITCLTIFLAIMLYIDIVKYFVAETYFEGLKIVPILLFANIFLGIYYNLSIWYKLTGKTQYGAYISIFGAFITIVLNLVLIPEMGYIGSAWATFFCYFSMTIVSYFLGQKFYPVPYNIKKFLLYSTIAIALFYLGSLEITNQSGLKLLANTALMLLFLVTIFIGERETIKNFFKKNSMLNLQ